jgi:hypothetical protein
MRFVYILAGWEGSAHDRRVLTDAQTGGGFTTVKGKYWLGDAGYGNSEFVITPYRNTKYHLKEQLLTVQKPTSAKELYNLRHSLLRNVVECIFGVLKRQWKVLGGKGPEYSITTQVNLLCILVGLYNFRKEFGEDNSESINLLEDDEDTVIITTSIIGKQVIGYTIIDRKRDEIADRI